MSKDGKKNVSDSTSHQRLVEIAKRMDSSLPNVFSSDQSIDDSEGLSAKELEELERVKNALDFLNAVKQDQQSTFGDLKTNANRQTLSAHSLGTLRDGAEIDQHESIDTVGRFEIQKLIGQGGFAKVYLARDPKLNRNVAIKVLRSSRFDSQEAGIRFEREAQAAAVLSHPNIVPVFETGEVESNRYIVSGYCDGITLEQWLKENSGKISPKTAANIVATLAEAVEHAHQRGVIHRDLKPANILLESAARPEKVLADSDEAAAGSDKVGSIAQHQDLDFQLLRIADFGLAKHAESTDVMETTEGAILGTPAYMSPEQASGKRDVGRPTDVYSLGVVLYELLTGRVPILGETYIDTLLAIKKEDIKPPRQLDDTIPRDLDAICLMSLQKSPANRYASANELAKDLNRWLKGEVVVARHPSRVERIQKWCTRNPVVAFALTAVTIALIFSVWQWRKARANYEIAKKQTQLAVDQTQVAISEARRAEGEKIRAETATTRAEEYLDQMTEIVDGFLDDIFDRSASLMSNSQKSSLYQSLELQKLLIEEEQKDVAIRKNRLRIYSRICRLQNSLGQYKEAVNTQKQAIAWMGDPANWKTEVRDLDSEFIELALEMRIDGLDALTNASQTEKIIAASNEFERIIEGQKDVLSESSSLFYLITAYNYRGLAWKRADKEQEAAEAFDAAKRCFEKLEVVESPLRARTVALVGPLYINNGSLLVGMNQFDKAFEYFDKADRLLKAGLERDSRKSSMHIFRSSGLSLWFSALQRQNETLKDPAITALCDQKSAEAVEIMEWAIQLEPNNNEFLPRLASVLQTRIMYLIQVGRLDDALKTSDRMVDINGLEKSLLGAKFAAGNQRSRSRIFQSNNQLDLALAAAEEAITRGQELIERNKNYLPGRFEFVQSHAQLILVVHQQEDSEKFLESLPAALESLESVLAFDPSPGRVQRLQNFKVVWLPLKAYHLARLNRWADAVTAAEAILKLEKPTGFEKKSYFAEAAKNMASILNWWSASIRVDDREPPAEYNAAAKKGLQWLKTAIEEDGFNDLEALQSSKKWKSLREHDGFDEAINSLLPSGRR